MTDAKTRSEKAAALDAQLNSAAALLMGGTERDRATAMLLRQVGNIITEAVREGRPIGMLPMRARTLAAAVVAEHEAT